jgi:signal peptidase II
MTDADPTPASASDAAASFDPPAWRSPLAWSVLLGTFAIGVVIDIATKYWAFRTVAGRPVDLVYEEVVGNVGYPLPRHEGVRALPFDLLDFHLVLNHGAVFGIGQRRRMVFVLFTLIAVGVALAVFTRWTRASQRWVHVGLGLILAGGIGNLYDRIRYGAVRDFLHMLPRWELPFGWRWPGNSSGEVFPWVFNVADVLLLAGMGILLIWMNRTDRKDAKAG